MATATCESKAGSTQGCLRRTPLNLWHSNIVQGLLRSKKGNTLRYVNDIPCDIIQSLETDADAAMEFVEQLKAGQVPSIVQDLPQEAVQGFRDVINIAFSLPTEILDVAEAAASDAAKVFDDIEDGSIIQDIEHIPGIVLSDITSGWADFTNELTGAWDDVTSDIGCFFKDCPQPTALRSCPAAAAATTTANGAAATTTANGAAATTTTANGAAATTTANGAAATTTTANGAAATTTANGAAATTTTANGAAATTTANGATVTTTTNRATATSQNEAQSTSKTQSSPQPTGATSLASTQSSWGGLGVLVPIAVGVFACALYL